MTARNAAPGNCWSARSTGTRGEDFNLPFASDRGGMPDMTDPSMTVPAQAGMLPELTGEEAHPAIQFFEAIGKAADTLTEEERDAIAAHIDELKAGGWVQQPDGSLRKPAILADTGKAKEKSTAGAVDRSVRAPRAKSRHPHLRIVE